MTRKPVPWTSADIVSIKISPSVLERSRARTAAPIDPRTMWQPPRPLPGVVPVGAPTMATDEAVKLAMDWAGEGGWDTFGSGFGMSAAFSSSVGFHGYPFLAQLAQVPEYRRASEIVAKEMTRKWVRIVAGGDTDKADKIGQINAAMKQFKVQDAFRRCAELDGFFGRGQIYIDVGTTKNEDELKTPLFIDDRVKIKQGGLKGFRVVEPLWTYPALYNSTEPLAPDFYEPQAWYVMGKQIHASRLLTFIGREVPDILKPIYFFGGISLSQLIREYVEDWKRTKRSVSDLVHSFSVMGIATNMSAVLSGAPSTGLTDRCALFNNTRDNSGTLLIDKDTEEFFNVSAPLGTLDHLQAQSQEHLCSLMGIPLVVFTGISPSGLNATSEFEMQAWHAWIEAQQEHLFGDNLEAVLKIIQLHEFGAIDEDIGFVWEPLGKMDPTAAALVRKSDADNAVAYIGAGVLAPEEERQRLADQEDTLYPGLDVDDLPELPDEGDPEGGGGEGESEGEPAKGGGGE